MAFAHLRLHGGSSVDDRRPRIDDAALPARDAGRAPSKVIAATRQAALVGG